MMTIVKIIASAILLMPCACAFKKLQTLIDEPASANAPRLAVAITNLVIVDGRATVDTRDVKTSKLAAPGRTDLISPAISQAHKDMLEKEMAWYSNGGASGPHAACTIQVVEGVERYKSTWSGEEMHARSKLRVSIVDSVHAPFVFSTVGEAEYYFTSNIANQSNFDRLYQKAMKTALFKAVESLSGALDTAARR